MDNSIQEALFYLSDEDYAKIWKRLTEGINMKIKSPLQAILSYKPDMKTLLNAIPEKREFLLHKLSENIFLKIQQDFDNGIYIELPEDNEKKMLFAYAITLPSYPTDAQADILLGWVRGGMTLTIKQALSIVENWNNWDFLELLNYSDEFHSILSLLPRRGIAEIGKKIFNYGPQHKYFEDFLQRTENALNLIQLDEETFSLIRNVIFASIQINAISYIARRAISAICNIIVTATAFLIHSLMPERTLNKCIFALTQLEKLQGEFSDNQIIMENILNFNFEYLESDFYSALSL